MEVAYHLLACSSKLNVSLSTMESYPHNETNECIRDVVFLVIHSNPLLCHRQNLVLRNEKGLIRVLVFVCPKLHCLIALPFAGLIGSFFAVRNLFQFFFNPLSASSNVIVFDHVLIHFRVNGFLKLFLGIFLVVLLDLIFSLML